MFITTDNLKAISPSSSNDAFNNARDEGSSGGLIPSIRRGKRYAGAEVETYAP
jgi:hypothetical protein